MASYIYPLYTYRISSDFGLRIHPITGKVTPHYGIDFSAPEGTDVMATADGVVLLECFHGENGYFDKNEKFIAGKGFGNNVFIEHENGNISHYAHLQNCDVKAGDRVIQGQHIGNVGSTGASTGPHLHFETLDGNEKVPGTNKTISQILIDKNKEKQGNYIKHIGFGSSVGRYDPVTGRTMDDIKNSIATNEDDKNRAIYGGQQCYMDEQRMCKINSDYHPRHTRETLPTKYYIWHAQEDTKVRLSHAQLEGTIHSVDEDIFPGEDYNCRCLAEEINWLGSKSEKE